MPLLPHPAPPHANTHTTCQQNEGVHIIALICGPVLWPQQDFLTGMPIMGTTHPAHPRYPAASSTSRKRCGSLVAPPPSPPPFNTPTLPTCQQHQ